MLDPKTGLLEKLPIFRGLSKQQLGSIIAIATKSFFEAGDNLITKDEAGGAAFLIMTGTARCLNFPGNPAAADHIGPGTLIGEMAMLAETVHAVTIQANERLRAMAIRREELRGTMERDPAIAQQISDNLLGRLQSFARELRRVDALLAKIERADTAHRTDGAPIARLGTVKIFPMALPAARKPIDIVRKFG